jgi:hypothetical protein
MSKGVLARLDSEIFALDLRDETGGTVEGLRKKIETGMCLSLEDLGHGLQEGGDSGGQLTRMVRFR